MTIPVIGGLATIDPYKNPVLTGMQQGLQMAYMPQQMQAEIGLKNAQAQYNTQRGGYYDQYGNFRQTQAENMPGLWSAQAERQKALADILYPSLANVNTAKAEELIPAQAAEKKQSANLKNAQAAVQPTIGAKNVASAEESAAKAMNLGSANGGQINSTVAGAQKNAPQGRTLFGNNGQPTQYPLSNSFTSWKPEQKTEYMDNNPYKAPPLPPGIARNDKIDTKTKMKINNLAPTAASLGELRNMMQDPEIAPFFGPAGPAMIKRGESIASGKLQGEYPPGYQKLVQMQSLGRMLIDSLATAQTGSISITPMKQFYEALYGNGQVSAQTALNTINQFGNILYKEGESYVASPYTEPVRDTAYFGLQQLRKAGFGDQKNKAQGMNDSTNKIYKVKDQDFSQSDLDAAAKQAGVSTDKFVANLKSQGLM